MAYYGPDISESESSGNDDRCNQLLGTMKRTGEYVGEKRKKNKKKRSELPPKQRKWLNARDDCVEKATNQMFLVDLRTKTQFQTDPKIIDYADKEKVAEAIASHLNKSMEADPRDLYLVGFDTEGDFATAQVFSRINGVDHAYIFQLSMINKDGKLPKTLEKFL